MNINITSDLIKRSREILTKPNKNQSEWCPVSLAVKEKFPKANIASVSKCIIVYRDERLEDTWGEIPLPKEVGQFIDAFDYNKNPAPTSFELSDKDVELLRKKN